MKINLRLLDSEKSIASKILFALIPEINKVLNKSINGIRSDIRTELISALKQEPEYGQLMAGSLRADLGIPDTNAVDNIVEQLADTTDVRIIPVSRLGQSIKGGIIIEAIQSDNISNVIYSNEAYVTDSKGYSMPWLEWLLLRGNSVLVKGYDVEYGPSPYSRSGDGIMVKSSSDWRVPPEYQGKVDNNWTTRAIDRLDNQISKIIKKNIEKNL